MATYKYQQVMFGGTDEGVVKYNISPEFGSQLKLGSVISINGTYTYKYGKTTAVAVGLGKTANMFNIELAKNTKTVNSGVASAFTFSITITEEILAIGDSRSFAGYIRFGIYDTNNYRNLSVNESNGQNFDMLQNSIAPEISDLSLSDLTGAYEHFGVGIQNKSKFVLEFDYLLDHLVVGIDILKADVTLDGILIPVYDFEILNGRGRIVLTPIPGVCTNKSLALSLTDTEGKTKTVSFGNAVSVNAYAAPVLSAVNNAELARRYDYKTNDYGTDEIVYIADGKYIALTFAGNVTSIAGKNAWTLKAEFSEEKTEQWTHVNTYTYEDGGNVFFNDDRELINRNYIFEPGLKYYVRITVTDFFETVTLIGTVEKATGYFHVTKYGVAFGKRSTATQEKPKTESVYPFYPEKGIMPMPNTATKINIPLYENAKFAHYDEYSVISLHIYGNIVHMTGVLKPTETLSGSTDRLPICYIPEEYAPSGNNLVFLQQGSGQAVWLLTVHPKDYYIEPCQVSFSRYRNGSSLTSANASTWLPFSAQWIID